MLNSSTDHSKKKKAILGHPPSTAFGWQLRRGKRRMPTVRLGGKSPRRPGRGFFLVRLCRRVKLKWLKAKYLSMLRKLKKHYDSIVKELMEGSSGMESFQQRMLVEASFAIPVMGLSFHPSSYTVDHRSLY